MHWTKQAVLSTYNALTVDDRGVSSVIGIVLMVGVVVIVAAVIGAFALGMDLNDIEPIADEIMDGDQTAQP